LAGPPLQGEFNALERQPNQPARECCGTTSHIGNNIAAAGFIIAGNVYPRSESAPADRRRKSRAWLVKRERRIAWQSTKADLLHMTSHRHQAGFLPVSTRLLRG